MIDLVNSEARINSLKESNLEIGTVIKQDEKSIIVQFLDTNFFVTVSRTYDFPKAFLEGELAISGEANGVFLHSLEIAEQLKAINTSLNTLGLDINDPAYKTLKEKRIEIENELDEIKYVFNEQLKSQEKEKQWDFIERTEQELNSYLRILVQQIEVLKVVWPNYHNYSGLRISSKYKKLQKLYDNCCSIVNSYVSSVKGKEEQLKKLYSDLGKDYIIKYASLNFDSYDSLLESTKELFEQYSITRLGDIVAVIPPDYFIAEEETDRILLKNNEGYYCELLTGKNPRLKEIENDPNFNIMVSQRNDVKTETRSVRGKDQNKYFYYHEELYYPEDYYSYSVFKPFDSSDVKGEIEQGFSDMVSQIELGIIIIEYYIRYWSK